MVGVCKSLLSQMSLNALVDKLVNFRRNGVTGECEAANFAGIGLTN